MTSKAESPYEQIAQDTITAPEATPDAQPVAEAPNNAADAKPDALASDSTKLQKRLRRIERANKLVMELNAEVAERDSEVKAAKGRLAAAQEDRDAAVVELSRIIADAKAGQDILPGCDLAESEPAETILSENTPISELGSKQLTKLVGTEIIDACKSRGAPIGLSEKILDKLEANEIRTIADLESKMRDQFAWWSILAKAADAAVVTRVVDSLFEYRRVCPVPERDQTIVESLAEKNAEPLEPIEPEPNLVA